MALDRTAEARHGVSLEVGQDQPIGIILRVAANDGVLKTPAAGHGPLHLALLIHEVEFGKGGEAVVRRHLLVQGGACAGAAVGGVAFDDRAADRLHQRADQLGTEVVAGGRFPGGDLDGELAAGCPVQGVIHALQALG